MVAARRAGLCRPWKFEKSPISTGLCGDCAESHLWRVNVFFVGVKRQGVTRCRVKGDMPDFWKLKFSSGSTRELWLFFVQVQSNMDEIWMLNRLR